ncbi:hypothetical protein DMH27_04280 [Raoultella planticola]|nr:hypothetical protein [Raoultella planticola]
MTILNPADAINTDAIDLDSSENITIEDCLFDVGDDAITLNPARGGRPAHQQTHPQRHGAPLSYPRQPWRHRHWFRKRRGIENVSVSDCVFEGTQRAIRLKSRRGRGGTIKTSLCAI